MEVTKQVDELLQETKALAERVETAEGRVKELEAEKAKAFSAPVIGGRSDSVEGRAMAAFGCSHAKQLLSVNTADEKFRYVPEELKCAVRNLKEAVDLARFSAQILSGNVDGRAKGGDDSESLVAVKNIFDTNYAKEVLIPMTKSFGSSAGTGLEWIPTAISQNYIAEYELQRLVEGNFRTVSMPTNPFVLPVQKAVTKARLASEGSAVTDANFQTAQLSMTAKKFAEYFVLPEELTEDSIVDIMAMARQEVISAQARAIEAAVINGATGAHIDSDTAALGATVAEKAWDGLRKLAIANSANGGTLDCNTINGGVLSVAHLRKMRAQMGKFGVNPAELVLLVSPSGYSSLLATGEVLTMEKYGPMATINTGALGTILGMKIVVSQYMRDDLNASGVYDGAVSSYTGLLCVNKSRFFVGQRRPIVVKAQADLPSQDRFLLASYQRKCFVGLPQSAAEKSVVYGVKAAL
jgi:HK97 family phage major capsid protein